MIAGTRAPVVGYEGFYEVTADGRIFSLSKTVRHSSGGEKRWPGREMRFTKQRNGYMTVNLSRNGKPKSFSVHRIVCTAFHGDPAPGMHVNHKNGIRDDNRSENLEWLSPSQNAFHSFRVLGRESARSMKGRFGAEHNRSVGVIACDQETGSVVHIFGSMHEAERAGFSASRICACVNGRSASHKRFVWRRADDQLR